MNARRFSRPSPALIVATVALFVALGGTAGAVVTAAVPLAKRALVADNAKKLGGMTSAQIASQAARAPGPAQLCRRSRQREDGELVARPERRVRLHDRLRLGREGNRRRLGRSGRLRARLGRPAVARRFRVEGVHDDVRDAPGNQTGPLYAVCLR